MGDVFDPDRPALNADGTLKDASKLEWPNSPSEETHMLPRTNPPGSPTIAAKVAVHRGIQTHISSPLKSSNHGFAIYKAAVEFYKFPSPGKSGPSKRSKRNEKKKVSP